MGIKQSVLTPIKLSYDCDVCGGNVLPNRGDMDSNHWYSTFDAKRIPHQCVDCKKDYYFKADITQIIFCDSSEGFAPDTLTDYLLNNPTKE